MRMSRLSTAMSPSASSSCGTREKYSGVSDSQEAIVALLTGRDTRHSRRSGGESVPQPASAKLKLTALSASSGGSRSS
jgi:hypothetical protein